MSLIEVLWLISGLAAMFFTTIHMRALYDDYRIALRSGRRVVVLVAKGYLRREIIRLLQGLSVTSIGAYAAIQPSPGPSVISLVGVVLTGVLILISALVSVQSYWDWQDRSEALHLITASHL